MTQLEQRRRSQSRSRREICHMLTDCCRANKESSNSRIVLKGQWWRTSKERLYSTKVSDCLNLGSAGVHTTPTLVMLLLYQRTTLDGKIPFNNWITIYWCGLPGRIRTHIYSPFNASWAFPSNGVSGTSTKSFIEYLMPIALYNIRLQIKTKSIFLCTRLPTANNNICTTIPL